MKIRQANKPFLLYVVVAIVAVFMRLSYAWIAIEQDFFQDLFLDSKFYTLIGQHIAAGQGAGATPYIMSPLYPYFLSLFVSDDGHLAVWCLRFVQMGIGVIACALIASTAKHYAGLAAGWVAGLLSACYGPLIHYETAILVETLQGFCFIVALWLLTVILPSLNSNRKKYLCWFIAGAVLGIAAGFRPIALLLVAGTIALMIMLALLRKEKLKPILLTCCLLLTGASSTVAPFTIRNYLVSHEFVLLSAYGGMNFWIGNHSKATGLFNTPPDYNFMLDPIGVEIARKATGENLTHKQASNWWSNRAQDDMKEDPARWATLFFKKVVLFAYPKEIPQLGNDFHWFERKAWPLQFPVAATPLLLFALLLPLSTLLFKRESFYSLLLPYSWMLIYIAGICMFFITGRYRAPIMPVVFMLAATHITLLGEQLFSPRKYIYALAIIIGLLFLGVTVDRQYHQSQLLPTIAMETGTVERQRGMALYDQGKYTEAESWYRKSLAIRENAITRGNLANALKAQGRIDEAEVEYRKVLEVTPRDYIPWYNLANLYRDYHRDQPMYYIKAAEYYQKSIDLNRKFAEPYLNLSLLYLRNGDFANAEKTVNAGLAELDSSQQKIRQQLVQVKVEIMLAKQKSLQHH